MTKTSKRRSSSVEHRSTKRRKPNSKIRHIYSTRVISWEEQLTLPSRFHEERDVWPALKILEQRGTGRKKEYLLEWEAHPRTGEVFEPSWEPADNVGQVLKQEWQRITLLRKPSSSPQEDCFPFPTRPAVKSNASHSLIFSRRVNNRRIIPDSSEEAEGAVINDSAPSRTPTLTGSPGSVESPSSPIEISETQQPQLPASVHVNVPPAPTDKSDWESLRESQFSAYDSSNHPSPFINSLPPNSSNSLRETPTTKQPNISASLFHSSVRSSLRSSTLANHNRGQGVQRVLRYQPVDQSPSSIGGQLQYSTAPAQQSSSVEITQASNHSSTLPRTSASQSFHAPRSQVSEEHLRKSSRQSINNQELGLRPKSTGATSKRGTQPWVFQSQISLQSQVSRGDKTVSQLERPALSGRCARKITPGPASQESALHFANGRSSIANSQYSPKSGMATRSTRQSPRLQTAIPLPSTTSPRIAVRTGSFRSRANFNPPEHSSPLAVTAELAEPSQDHMQQNVPDSSFIENSPQEQISSGMSFIPPTSIAPSAMHIDPTQPSLLGSLSQESVRYDATLNTLPNLVQESIEEEPVSSAEEASLASKASSSQESLRNERVVPQIDGLVMPTIPILGDDEYAIALPAEGKVQAIYSQTIKVKRKAILKFIRRRGSVNTASTSAAKTIERNEMIELIERLHHTTTHTDLGLPGIPTQYTILSQEHAAYADYAGSKFVFLGYLMDLLQRRHENIVIMAKSGATQDLLEEYLYLKNVRVRRHERAYNSQALDESTSANPRVELLSTKASDIVHVSARPSLIIAFDASFEALDPQVQSLKEQAAGQLPILHLLVTNSSEHVERCLPVSMPSPIRLRLLVRATYQAQMNLGGSPTIITNPSDEIDGRPMDLADISRAVRKSPNRRLQMVAAVVANATLSDDFAANWTLSPMPELALEELDNTPSTGSTVSATTGPNRARSQTPILRVAGQARNRSRTPVSRAGTPSAKKRQLEIDTSGLIIKRQRMTPVTEISANHDSDLVITREQELLRAIDALKADLANEKKAREAVDKARTSAEERVADLQLSIAIVQRRYEKRTKKSHEQQKANKSLTSAVESSKLRVDKVVSDNVILRQQLAQQKKELESARTDLKSAGGDIAALEIAREEARDAITKAVLLEKSLENSKRDFEFLRTQYQNASNNAAGFGTQVTDLEARVADLTNKASDEKRRLKELNYSENVKQHLAKIQQLEAERKSILVMYKKLEEESKLLKRTRGVQTRGSSTAPGSPGQRSRQGSPAAGVIAPPSGSRASVLRHER